MQEKEDKRRKERKAKVNKNKSDDEKIIEEVTTWKSENTNIRQI